VLLDADEACFNKFIDLYNSCDLQEEKMRIAQALGSVKDEKLVGKVLEFSLSVMKFFKLEFLFYPKSNLKKKISKTSVRSQDSVSIISAVSLNVASKRSAELAWEFIKQNWDTIFTRYSVGFFISSLVKVRKSFLYFHFLT